MSGGATVVSRSSIFSCAKCAESRNVCDGVLPKQYLPECARSSLYSRSQPSRSVCNSSSERGALSGCGQRFNSRIVARLRREYQLKSRYDCLREKGLWTLEEMSAGLDVGSKCVIAWRNQGLLRGYPVNDRGWLYDDPGPNPPRKAQGVKLAKRPRFPQNVGYGSKEVQCEA